MEWNKNDSTTQPVEGQLDRTTAGLRSAVKRNRLNATNRECCEGKYQCGGDTNRRSAARAGIDREPERTWAVGGSREGRAAGTQVNKSSFLICFWRKLFSQTENKMPAKR